MISEGYPEQKSRETGLQSVIKNSPLAERYSVLNEGGVYFLSLKAGNRREIARSCSFKTEAEAKALLTTLTTASIAGDFNRPTEKIVGKDVKPKGTKAPKATASIAASIAGDFNRPTEIIAEKDAKVKAPVATSVTKMKVEKESKAVVSIAGDFNRPTVTPTEAALSIDDFLGHENIWNEHGKTGYSKFQHANSKFYFVVYNPDGSIYLRSNGFAKAEDCDKTLTEVQNVIEVTESYRITENEGVFYTILSDAKGTELARSAAYFTYTDAFITTPRGREEVVAGNLY